MDNLKTKQIGLVFNNMSASQTAMFAIKEINKYIDSRELDLDFCIFFSDFSPCCLKPKCPLYHVSDSISFKGNLIATNFSTAISTQESYRAKKFFYIQDLEWTRGYFNYQSKFLSIMEDENIKRFCRCIDHRNYIKDIGFEVDNMVVENFNLKQLLEIINAN